MAKVEMSESAYLKQPKEPEENEIGENSENINLNNLNINEYLEDYEEKPTYKQRKLLQKQNKEIESDNITSSSKNSFQDNDEIIVEEKYYDNQRQEDANTDNDKLTKRYHRRYRSKKIKSNFNDNNLENGNNTHKSYTKYRKKHSNY